MASRSGRMPRSPMRTSMGSPGTRWINMKLRRVIPKKVGITKLMRVRTNLSMLKGGRERRRARKTPARRLPRCRPPLLLQIDAVELMAPERAQAIVDHLVAHRHIDDRMRHREPRRLFLEDLLRLLIELGALGDAVGALGRDQQIVERLVAPLGRVRAGGRRRGAAEENVEEVVRIAIVAGPPAPRHLMAAGLDALPVLAPLVTAPP